MIPILKNATIKGFEGAKTLRNKHLQTGCKTAGN